MKPKFNIGDEVCFIGTKGKKKRFGWLPASAKKEKENETESAQVFRVTDVIIENCYGGTQVHYQLRPMSYGHDDVAAHENTPVGVHKELIKAREIELEPK